MKISKKIFLSFSVVIILACIVGIIGIGGMSRSHRAGLAMYEKEVLGLEYAGKAISHFQQIRLDFQKVIISGFYDDFKGANDMQEDFEKDIEKFEYWMSEIYRIADNDEIIKFHDKIMEVYSDSYLPKAQNVIKESLNDIPDHGHKLHINVMFSENRKIGDEIDQLFTGLMDLNTALANQKSMKDAKNTYSHIVGLFAVLVFSIVVAIITSTAIAKSITKPINDATKALAEISQGNFDTRMQGGYKGALGIFANSLNTTGEKLSLYLNDKLQAEQSAYESEVAKVRAESASEAVFASITYASKIQKSLLPKEEDFQKAFSDYSVIWKPRDIVGGDIYWIKTFKEGTLLCVCDCTGHGTPGALLTMLVISAFQTLVNENNYKDTAETIWRLEQILVNNLRGNNPQAVQKHENILDIKDGCDLAVLYIAGDGNVSVSSSNMSVFVCDGSEVMRIRGQRLFIGEGRLKKKQDIQVINIPANPNCKFYISSDGLSDQIGEQVKRPFGYRTVQQIILQNHEQEQQVISKKIWEAFEEYRGTQDRRDDVQLITFRP